MVNLSLVKNNLLAVLDEVGEQDTVGELFPSEQEDFAIQIRQIREWIEDAKEYGLAYEALISMLEEFPFKLSGQAAIKLLEVGLLMQFKTDQPKDAEFDNR